MTIPETNDKNTEQKKIDDYFDEVNRLLPTNPDLVKGREFFAIWEKNCEPRPFNFKGSSIIIGQNTLEFYAKSKYTAHLTWDGEQNVPVFVAANKTTEHHFAVLTNNGKVQFEKIGSVNLNKSKNSQGEEIEVVYDVIDRIITQKSELNIEKLTKKEFLDNLKTLSDSYTTKFLKRMAGFSAAKIRDLVEQASSDLAIDDLSSQLTLPFEGGGYAQNSGGSKESKKTVKPATYNIYSKNHWQIVLEMEFLMTIAKLAYETENDFFFPLKDCEKLGTSEKSGTLLKIRDVEDVPLVEGSIMGVYNRGVNVKLGTFVVRIFDYDTIYGELFWEEGESVSDLGKAYLKPRKAPHKFLMQKTKELFSLVKEQPESIRGALKYILGLEESKLVTGRISENMKDMDFSQNDAWSAAVNPDNRLVGIQGPPGTGKTWVLVQVIRHLAQQGKRILVTAPSNTAVDNICRVISDLPVLRFGRQEKVHDEVQETCWKGKEENIETYLKKYGNGKNGQVFAATHLISLMDRVITQDLQHNGLFDVVIFDESGMSRMDEFLLCAQLGERIIAFGDQKQLPPFSLSKIVLKKLDKEHHITTVMTRQIIEISALEWLSENRKLPLIMLKRSYRCQNPRLLRFSSTLFYNARVKTSEKAEYFNLPYHKRKEKYPQSTLRFYRTSFLPDDIRCEKIVFAGSKIGIENQCEAHVCKQVVINALDLYQLKQITVISPYKRQVSLIKELLHFDLIKDRISGKYTRDSWQTFLNSRIATVDSFQGGESDLVIISYVRSNKEKGIGFVDNPNRINVAHTRCRREIVIVGDLECLMEQAKTDIFIKMERAFSRDGIIIDVDESFISKS